MTIKKQREISQQFCDVYAGILFNNQIFAEGNNDEFVYNFDCTEFETLKQKYNLEDIAGKGSDFGRAIRLLHYLSPRLKHSSWYDNHVPCNALDLLEYSLGNPEHGINCLNKSKILQECCLALGIYARRVSIMPFSPYDFDNHVVTEIYDRQLQKWVMLDPTTDGYFVDENKTPLSLLEMRHNFANEKFVTFLHSNDDLSDVEKLKNKYVADNSYICKNLFYIYADKISTFGVIGDTLAFVPVGYSIKANTVANLQHRLNCLPPEYENFRSVFENNLETAKQMAEPSYTNIGAMANSPVK